MRASCRKSRNRHLLNSDAGADYGDHARHNLSNDPPFDLTDFFFDMVELDFNARQPLSRLVSKDFKFFDSRVHVPIIWGAPTDFNKWLLWLDRLAILEDQVHRHHESFDCFVAAVLRASMRALKVNMCPQFPQTYE